MSSKYSFQKARLVAESEDWREWRLDDFTPVHLSTLKDRRTLVEMEFISALRPCIFSFPKELRGTVEIGM
jgi:hypothetical protein